jgi:hypothetical protein
MIASRSRSGRASADWNASLEGGGGERGPAAGPGLQVLVCDGLAGAEGVQAGPFLGLQLEQLQQPHRLAGGGDQSQAALGRGQHHSGGGDAEQVHAPVRQTGQQVDDVVVVDEGVGHLDQRPDHVGFAGHPSSPPECERPGGRSRPVGVYPARGRSIYRDGGLSRASAPESGVHCSRSRWAMTSSATSASRRSLLKA